MPLKCGISTIAKRWFRIWRTWLSKTLLLPRKYLTNLFALYLFCLWNDFPAYCSYYSFTDTYLSFFKEPSQDILQYHKKEASADHNVQGWCQWITVPGGAVVWTTGNEAGLQGARGRIWARNDIPCGPEETSHQVRNCQGYVIKVCIRRDGNEGEFLNWINEVTTDGLNPLGQKAYMEWNVYYSVVQWW